MVGERANKNEEATLPHGPLLPERHPNRDFFVVDVFDTLPFKSDLASMEHPVFSLSTKPEHRVLTYEHNGNRLEISPSGYGLATIHDKDVLLYCGSILLDRINQGEKPSKTIRVTAHDLLVSCNRPTNNLGYERLKAALDRLSGTRLKTDIETGGERQIENFGLIDAYGIVERSKNDNRMVAIQIRLSEWFYNAIVAKEMLSISRKYFRLRKPLERRIYELARKHCGSQKKWLVGLKTLQKKTGSKSSEKEFRRLVRGIAKTDHLPDYNLALEDDMVTITYRHHAAQRPETALEKQPRLRSDTYEKARAIAQGLDIYALEAEWQDFWESTGRPTFQKGPDAAFLGFCKARVERGMSA